jgi:integrase/recombinase XerD
MKIKKNTYPVTYLWTQLHNYLKEYLPFIRNASPHTVTAYRDSLEQYINFLTEKKNTTRNRMDFSIFSRQNIKEYLFWLNEEKHLKPKTCNLRLTAIRAFMEHCAQEDMSLMAVFTESCTVRNLKVPVKPLEYLQNDEMKALLAAVETQTRTGRRNRMLLIFEYDAALRVEELVNVRLCDLHLDKKTPFVSIIGKGRKMRSVPLMEKTVDHLKLYLAEYHPSCHSGSESPLFYSRRDNQQHKLSTDSVQKLLKKYALVAKSSCSTIAQNISCHMMRKTRAMDLYQSGIPLAYVAQILGHESISTTTGFYAFATLETLQEAFKQAVPKAYDEEVKWRSQDTLDKLYHL